MDGYWRRVEERGAPDKSPYRAGFAQTICVAETDEEAERLYWQHINYFYNRCLHVYPGFADAPGYRTIKTIQTGALSQYAPPRGGFAELTWKDLIEGGHVIAGIAGDRAPAHGGADQGRCTSATSSASCMSATCRRRSACIRPSCSPRR